MLPALAWGQVPVQVQSLVETLVGLERIGMLPTQLDAIEFKAILQDDRQLYGVEQLFDNR